MELITRTIITQTRNSRGLSLAVVAKAVNTDQTNLSRVERGVQIPKRELARALFAYYGGALTLGQIYDPNFETEVESPKPAKNRKR